MKSPSWWPLRLDLARSGAVLAIALAALAQAGCDRQPPVPDFSYVRLDGTRASSAELRGQVVLVNFWATSCVVCVREMPELVATHEQFQARGLRTLAVAMSYDPPARVAQFAETRRLPFEVVIDNTGAIARAFGDVKATPTTFLIDRSGAVVGRYVGAPDFAELQTTIARLVGNG